MRTLSLMGGCAGALLVLGCSGNSSTAPTIVEGDATLNFSNCIYRDDGVYGPAGAPTVDDYGGTVLNGSTGGYAVSCTVSQDGTYSVHGHIAGPTLTLNVDAQDISAGAQMIFYEPGDKGTPNSMTSVVSSTNSNTAYNCTLTVSGSGKLSIEPGAIFAKYSCPTVADPQNLATICQADGLFYFTGCSK